MMHRNINTNEWSRMAIDSLFDDGTLTDWREFFLALKKDERLERETLFMCDHHSNIESVTLARILVNSLHEPLHENPTDLGLD